MPDTRGRSRAAALLCALFVSISLLLAAASCKLGDAALDQANSLNQSAGQDIGEIEKLVRENKDKEALVTRALNAGDLSQARRLIDESVQAIDRGMERGASAADKFARAAALDIDQPIKEYLRLRAQSVNKALEAFRELRQGILAFRESIGSADKSAVDRARSGFRQTSERFEQLINESGRLERQADDIARRNPDKIKPGP
ncbi:MAG TPA: hypothetical protein VJT74_15060 [Pyrinomonadaceae bacterium]|nr:hypothetical protein [Pyrinomonadaceae bacterium]